MSDNGNFGVSVISIIIISIGMIAMIISVVVILSININSIIGIVMDAMLSISSRCRSGLYYTTEIHTPPPTNVYSV